MRNRRFLIGLQVIALLAESRGDALDSYLLATRLRLRPSVLRRSMRDLATAGLITTRSGPGGGARLTRSATTITVADIWRATIAASPFGDATVPRGQRDAVARSIAESVQPVLAEALGALETVLGRTSVAMLRTRRRPAPL